MPQPLTAPLGSRLRGNDVGVRGRGVRERGDAFNALPPGASPAVASLVSVAWAPFALRKGRYRLNRRLRRFSQMGYDAPLPFVSGFWVPAPVSGYGAGCAGMTGECAGMTG